EQDHEAEPPAEEPGRVRRARVAGPGRQDVDPAGPGDERGAREGAHEIGHRDQAEDDDHGGAHCRPSAASVASWSPGKRRALRCVILSSRQVRVLSASGLPRVRGKGSTMPTYRYRCAKCGDELEV